MKRVAKRWCVGMLCMLFVVIAAFPVGAAGPYDGVWFTNQSCSDPDFSGMPVASVTENENFGTYWGVTFNVVVFVLDPVWGEWTVGFGTRSGSTIQGVIFDPFFATQTGTFTLTASSPTSLTGTAQGNGVSCSITGTKVF